MAFSANVDHFLHPRRRLPLKERMEIAIQRRREKEQVHQELWTNTAKYFSTWDTRATKFNEWTSKQYYEDSIEAYERNLRAEEKRRQLEMRREKLRAMLDREKEEYERELEKIEQEYKMVTKGRCKHRVDTCKLEYLKQHAAEVERKKEEERRKDVALKDFLRWKANNPAVRDIESRQHALFVRKAWEDQVKDKHERDRIAKQENYKLEKELEDIKDEELKRIRELEEEKRKEVEKWKADIARQREELKQKDMLTKKLDQELDDLEKRESLIKETVNARERLQKEREQRKLLAKFWAKQTRLKIRAMCNERIQSITDEKRMLEYLKHLDDKREEDRQNANVSAVTEKINAAAKCLEEHLKLEAAREKESASLFEEEARAFLRQQEIVWENERKQRERVIQDVITTLRDQMEEKRLNNLKSRESIDAERGKMLMEMETKDKQIGVVEAETHQRTEEMKAQLVHQIYEKRKLKEREMLESLDVLTRLKFEEDQEKLFLDTEESRLKTEGYQPKFYGFKKLAW